MSDHHHDHNHHCESTGNGETYSRRLFMQQGMAFLSMAATVPMFMQQSAKGIMLPVGSLVTSQAGIPEERVLVVIQLAGGNDGLNTIIPFESDAYFSSRPQIAIGKPGSTRNAGGAALELPNQESFGLHPNLTGLRELIDRGHASIIQGVGYPNPNRSHFTSTDIWHTGNTSAQGYGWLGRYFDNTCDGAPSHDQKGSIAIGNKSPLALYGKTQKAVNFETEELFKWAGTNASNELEESYDQINRAESLDGVEKDSQLDFLVRTALDAQVSSDRIRAAVSKRPLVRYPNNKLAQQLQLIASMVRADLPTRVYYASLGGFDTHANQIGSHANLMRQLGDSLLAFQNDLAKQGNTGKVTTMVFSEFGRRVAQNGSSGTDHGTAAPMFVIGEHVTPGLIGEHPSLTKLDQGDLMFSTDFREVYTSVLNDWMGADAKDILGKNYRNADIFNKSLNV